MPPLSWIPAVGDDASPRGLEPLCASSVDPGDPNAYVENSDCGGGVQWTVAVQSESELGVSCPGNANHSFPINAGGALSLAWTDNGLGRYNVRLRTDFYSFPNPCTSPRWTWFTLMDHGSYGGGTLPHPSLVWLYTKVTYNELTGIGPTAIGPFSGISRMGVLLQMTYGGEFHLVELSLYLHDSWGDVHVDADIVQSQSIPGGTYVHMDASGLVAPLNIALNTETEVIIPFGTILADLVARGFLPAIPGGAVTSAVGIFTELNNWESGGSAIDLFVKEFRTFDEHPSTWSPSMAGRGQFFELGEFHGFTNDGDPAAMGLLYSWVSGSARATAKATYQDIENTILNEWPVELDANGRAIVVSEPGLYEWELRDSDGNVLWSIDGWGSPGAAWTITAVDADYTVPAAVGGSNRLIFADASGGNIVITLYSAVGTSGEQVMIIRTDTTPGNTVTVASADLINGQASEGLSSAYETIAPISTGATWIYPAGATEMRAGFGTVSRPSVIIAKPDTGFYAPAYGELAASILGNQAFALNAQAQAALPFQNYCSLYHSTTQAHTSSGSFVAMTFDTEEVDIGGCHAGGSPTRITIPTGGGGKWQFGGSAGWTGTATATVMARFRKNGGTLVGSANGASPGIGGQRQAIQVLSQPIVVVAGDYFEFEVQQTSGGTITFGSATRDEANQFWGRKLP